MLSCERLMCGTELFMPWNGSNPRDGRMFEKFKCSSSYIFTQVRRHMTELNTTMFL